MKLDSNNHSVFSLNYHLVLVIKYRKQVLNDDIEDEMQISVNNFGKVELFFDTICEYTSHVAKIENLFKKQISCFNLNI